MKNKHWRTYVTDRAEETGQYNWLRIESTFKPSNHDVNTVTREKGFTSAPSCIEIYFKHSIFITTWSVAPNAIHHET